MAIKLGALKLPFLGRGSDAEGEPAGAAAGTEAAGAGGLPLIGRLPIGRQLQILIGALVLLLAIIAGIAVVDNRQATFSTIYIASVGKLQMLSQRLAKAAQQASQGNAEAFKQLRSSRDEFAGLIKLLAFGGESGGATLPPTSEKTQPLLNALDREWSKTERNAGLVIDEEKNLLALGSSVRAINANNPVLQELTDEIAALSVQSGGAARQNAIAAQLMMLTQRMAKNANTMLAENIVDPEVAFLLGKDTNTFRDTLQALLQGSEALRIARVADAEMRGKLGELQTAFADYQKAVSAILGNQARLVGAKRATFEIFNDSEALLQAA
jgi:twitching motility protein PilJ